MMLPPDHVAALTAVEFVVAGESPDNVFPAESDQSCTPVGATQHIAATAAGHDACPQLVLARQDEQQRSDHHEQESRQPGPLFRRTCSFLRNRRYRRDGDTLLQVHGAHLVPCRRAGPEAVLGASGRELTCREF
jgi:hypothetical protein